jgi:hypothetical protein
MPKLETPINPNGRQEIPEPSKAIIDTPIDGPLACNCDQALLLLELLKQAKEDIKGLKKNLEESRQSESIFSDEVETYRFSCTCGLGR